MMIENCLIPTNEEDDLQRNILREEAEKRRHPGDRLTPVCGGPDVPADEVVEQERRHGAGVARKLLREAEYGAGALARMSHLPAWLGMPRGA